MAFTDDLSGLSRAELIARVRAAAREHGDELTDREAGHALGLYGRLAADWTPQGRAQLLALFERATAEDEPLPTTITEQRRFALREQALRERHPEPEVGS
jgi:hypothetical protein